MWYVYLMRHSDSKRFYIRMTADLDKRLMAHNAGKNPSTQRKDGVWLLAYYESYVSKADAHKRERGLKRHGRAKQELMKRIEDSLLKIQSGAGNV